MMSETRNTSFSVYQAYWKVQPRELRASAAAGTDGPADDGGTVESLDGLLTADDDNSEGLKNTSHGPLEPGMSESHEDCPNIRSQPENMTSGPSKWMTARHMLYPDAVPAHQESWFKRRGNHESVYPRELSDCYCNQSIPLFLDRGIGTEIGQIATHRSILNSILYHVNGSGSGWRRRTRGMRRSSGHQSGNHDQEDEWSR